MLELIPVEAENVVAYRAEGTITVEDFAQVADEIEEKLEDHESLLLYAELFSIEGMEPSAIVEDVRFGARHIQDLQRFDRVAVVTDADWIGKVAGLEGAMIPGLEIEWFDEDDSEPAMAWLISGD